MIKILNGSGYDENWEKGKDILTKRLDRENSWIKKFYPYQLSERERKSSNLATIGSLYN